MGKTGTGVSSYGFRTRAACACELEQLTPRTDQITVARATVALFEVGFESW